MGLVSIRREGEKITRQEERIRARRRQRRRQARMVRRVVFGVCLFIILILCIYGHHNHKRVLSLQSKIDRLEQQLKKSKSDSNDLKKQLDELQKELEQKQQELDKKEAALYDDPNKPNVYMTFDDGPSSNTDTILDTLAANNIRATFFCIAQKGEANEKRYQRIVNEGHTIGMHSYTHEYGTVYASLESFEQDVTQISDYIFQMTGVRPKYYRFPGGSSNTVSKVPMKECIRYLNQSGLTYFDWNAQNDDATGKSYTASQLVEHAMKNVKTAGDNVVLLMHDEQTKTATAEALPTLIKRLKNAGYDILPITDKTPLVQHVSKDSVS